MFQDDDSIWTEDDPDYLIVNTKYGWSLHVPIEAGLVEINARLARFMAMFTGHVSQPEEGEPLPLAIVVARRHGIQALPCPLHLKFGNSN